MKGCIICDKESNGREYVLPFHMGNRVDEECNVIEEDFKITACAPAYLCDDCALEISLKIEEMEICFF